MVGRVVAVFTALSLVLASRALAVVGGGVRIGLDSGIGFTPMPLQYGEIVQLPSTCFVADGAVLVRVTEPVWGIVEAGYYRFGDGEPLGEWAAIATPMVGPSSIRTLTAGLRLNRVGQERAAPYFLAAVGVGQVRPGDVQFGNSIPSEHLTAPAFVLGAGFRTKVKAGGPEASVGIRWVTVLTDGGSTNIVPIVFGIGF